MKAALALLFGFALLAGAQDARTTSADPQAAQPQAPDSHDSQATELRRLVSITWDLKNHKLVWVVQKGTAQDGEFVPAADERYEISPREAVMAAEGEERGFTGQEAAWLQHLLDILTMYCAESVVWWQQGEGEPLDPNPPAGPPAARPKKPAEPPAGNVQRVALAQAGSVSPRR